jgi:hypothetical protein
MAKQIYTQAETEAYLFARNQQRQNEREAKKKRPVMVHLSKHAIDTILKYGLSKKGTTFTGSIREKFTGPRRNNFGPIYSRS